ncbi:MAG: XdhC family protein, partial [Sphaerochaetaceae bacterium]
MNTQNYYTSLLEALKIDMVERRTILQGENVGDEALLRNNKVIASHAKAIHDWSDPKLLKEQLASEVRLVIFGGGHIALDLYHLAIDLALQVTIVDDRPEFCNQERFPKGQCLCGPFEEVLSHNQSWIRPYFIIATRGHAYDRLCLEKTLRLPHAYIGMIGSKKKV